MNNKKEIKENWVGGSSETVGIQELGHHVQVSSLCNTTQVLDLPTLGTQIYQNPCLANYFAALYKIVTPVMIKREMQNVKGNDVIILLSLNISKSITVFCLLDDL
jgi:hypothetical protein